MKLSAALGGGLAAATVVTTLHQIIKNSTSKAPRMDLLGMQVLDKAIDKTGAKKPSYDKRYAFTMAGDIIANTLYYSLTALGGRKGLGKKGGILGLAAGLGAVLLPKPMGLNSAHSNRTGTTRALSVGLYLLGGLVSSVVTKKLANKR